ncbi:MAG TPA: acyl--CoA ligase, partial [Nitrosopumilus sp.]|nr:acyl--CoA ligase [Nitrosopumilus sp.]
MSDSVKTVKYYLDYHAKNNSDKIFVICPHTKKQISFLEFKQNIEKLGSYLKEQNLKKGDAVCTVIENSISSIYLMLGIMYAGMVQVPLNVVAGEDQLSYVLDHSDSNIVFTSDQYLDLSKKLIQKQTRKIDFITVDKNTFIEQLNKSASSFTTEVEEANPALLMYTSGTTGKPKGVMLSNKNIISGGQNCIDAHDITAKDRAMCVLPLFHINGAINTVLAPLISGSSVVLCEKFSVNNFWKFISEFQCTWFSVVPT